MRGPTLRGLRAPGCASHFKSCADGWWALFFPPTALSVSLTPFPRLSLSGLGAALQQYSYHYCMSVPGQV